MVDTAAVEIKKPINRGGSRLTTIITTKAAAEGTANLLHSLILTIPQPCHHSCGSNVEHACLIFRPPLLPPSLPLSYY